VARTEKFKCGRILPLIHQASKTSVDVEMMITPEAYPLFCKNRKRNHDEGEISVRVLIDSTTYVSEVDVRQERNCDISISNIQDFVCCQIQPV